MLAVWGMQDLGLEKICGFYTELTKHYFFDMACHLVSNAFAHSLLPPSLKVDGHIYSTAMCIHCCRDVDSKTSDCKWRIIM